MNPSKNLGYKSTLVLLVGVTTFLSNAGCGGDAARVDARVLLDGKEVVETDSVRCEVTLKPIGGGPSASGSADSSGHVPLAIGASRSIPPGEYRASVRVREITPPSQPGGYSSSRDLVPRQYSSSATSGLSYSIEPGSNDIKIKISTSRKTATSR